ncbi:MAG: LysR family transcriptional regulator [Clostridia bacterium]|nr:LysR family transcriptional regulator [Clostridia bacterium]MBQ9848253.1 LysR family transcriptional regulator [Clostridia bacterium]
MNIMHMRYAIEVAKIGSINRAAEKLLVAQPNLSRSIKELESVLGITIFDRSGKGMNLTPEGETFIGYAKKIIAQIDEVESIYKDGGIPKQRFSASVPRASYISEAFCAFARSLNSDPAELIYKETSSSNTIKLLTTSDYKLGIVRCAEHQENYYKEMLAEKGIDCRLLARFRYVLVVRADSKLAAMPEIKLSDLSGYIEVAHADPTVPSLPSVDAHKEALSRNVNRRIYIFDRSSQFEILSSNPDAFMWVSPVRKDFLDLYGLVQRNCVDNTTVYKDLLACRRDHSLTALDKRFISELEKSKKRNFD